MRRGRGFSAQEVANLRSWGIEPRPDEIAAPPPPTPFLEALRAAQSPSPRPMPTLSAAEAAAQQRRRAADSRRAAQLLEDRLRHPELI